jgi:hypothetical protein
MSLFGCKTDHISHLAAVCLFFLGLLSILASGGGGGGNGVQPITYIGNTDPASITPANAAVLVASVIGGGEIAGSLDSPSAVEVDSIPRSLSGSTEVINQLRRSLKLFQINDNTSIRSPFVSGVRIDETFSCTGGGTFSFSGNVNDGGTGTVNFSYNNCREDGTTLNGSGSLRIDAFDMAYMDISDATMSFTRLTMTGLGCDIAMSGSFRIQYDYATNFERATANMVMQNSFCGRMGKAENYMMESTYDDIFVPTEYSSLISGRLYDSEYGFIDISTPVALHFSDLVTDKPDAGGKLMITGAANAHALMTMLAGDMVLLELDLDDDTVYETSGELPWDILSVAGTDPDDTDGDGIPDTWEQSYGMNAEDYSDSELDMDSDDLSSRDEYAAGTNPMEADTDADQMPDGWEVANIFDPVDPADASQDADGDGITNLAEYLAGSDPNFPGEWLDYQVVDAEYSAALDTVVMVASNPNRLYLFDTSTQTQTQVDLPYAPTAVSVSPDGLYAAVGHDSYASYVDLSTESVVDTYPVSTNVLDIVLDGNGYIHAFPAADQWENIRTIEIATGTETLHTGLSIYAGTRARLHPGGTWIYGADNGLSPSDIEKYDISSIPVTYLYDSPYHGDYDMCGDLWFSEDGLKIFTKCGNVFNATADALTDMTYYGTLENITRTRSVTHSTEAGLIAAIPYSLSDETIDTSLSLFNDDTLTLNSSVSLPEVTVDATSYPSHGRFVFFSDDGSRYSMIIQTDPASGSSYDYGVVSFAN